MGCNKIVGLFLFVSLLGSSIDAKLIQVVEVFRHGARYIIDDGFVNSGELLPSGMRQQYNLGRQLREEYIVGQGLLSEVFNHTEIYVRSTDVNRTIQSVQSHLAGMYPDGPQIPSNVDNKYLRSPYEGATDSIEGLDALPNFYQVIPVHVEPSKYQVLLPECPNEDLLTQQDIKEHAPLISQFEEAAKEQRIHLCGLFNVTNCPTADTIGSFYGDYVSAVHDAKPMPPLTVEEVNQLHLMSSFYFVISSAGRLHSRVIGQPFYKEVLSTLRQKSLDPNSSLKWIIYSAHDTNVVRYAKVLNLTSADCLLEMMRGNRPQQCQMSPDFASSLLFELHQEGDEFFVKVRYEGNYQTICGGVQACPLEVFEKMVLNEIATDEEFTQSCGSSPKSDTQHLLHPKDDSVNVKDSENEEQSVHSFLAYLFAASQLIAIGVLSFKLMR